MLIQIKFSDTMRVAVTQRYIIYIIIASEILFRYRYSGIEHLSKINNTSSLHCSGVKRGCKNVK